MRMGKDLSHPSASASMIIQKVKRPCISTTLPESPPSAFPKLGLVMLVLSVLNPSGCRLRKLKTLKKFAFSSKFAASLRKPGRPNFLATVKSMSRYLGPRKELRPMPGRSPATAVPGAPVAPIVEKNLAPPPGKLLPVIKALLEVSVPAPPK